MVVFVAPEEDLEEVVVVNVFFGPGSFLGVGVVGFFVVEEEEVPGPVVEE